MGIHSVHEVFKVRPQAIRSLWLRKGYEDSHELKEFADQAEKFRISIELKSPELLNRFTTGHQGLGGSCESGPRTQLEAV